MNSSSIESINDKKNTLFDTSFCFNLIDKYYFKIYNHIHKQTNNMIYPLYIFTNILKLYVNIEYTIPDIYLKNLILLSSQLNSLWSNTNEDYIYISNNQININEINTNLTNTNIINANQLLLYFKKMKQYNKDCLLLIHKIFIICKHINEENTTIEYDPYKFNNFDETNNNETNQNEIKQSIKPNFQWFTTLIQKYTYYDGKFPITTIQFINFFKYNWDKINDLDTLILTPIFEEILGGVSIQYNAYCLEDWIKKNIDIVKNIENWILTA